ncbi:hypothetical protein SAMN04488034_11241 [Salinimicrobium catena]|uniref:Peptidase E n=1 Tax=Salinimicrobium catena TaxID=390640 RepID=A0A1H5PDZ7_9FLAO|nr:DUF6702 family protein [Salinimicrobium catena]SDL79925.1 hypothetical protein SAMN04488140_11241 [Salinimicrobium catena]SEF11834.1 hypothetical protein SAMN04488034_11241 [Salinimicrobium catena]
MRKRLLLFLALLPLLAFTAAHKFYVSATDIEYNEENRSLQIISYVFVDDLEKLLQTRYSEELFLLKEGEHESADQYVEKYFRDKLMISVDGKPQTFSYIGKEYDKDQLLVYLEVEQVKPFKNISVENGILTDLFPEQKNVVKVERDGKIKSLLLSRNELRGTLNFGK